MCDSLHRWYRVYCNVQKSHELIRDITEDTSTEIAITPCTSGGSSNTFVCGVNTTDCQSDSNTFTLSSDTSLVLRPAQIAALVGSSLQTSTATGAQVTVTSIPEGYYTGGAMAGLAIGIAIPLLIALGIMYILLRKERQKFGHSKPKLMYKLPDDIHDDDFTPTPPPSVPVPAMPTFESNRSSHVSAVTSMATSRRGSLRTIHTTSSRPVLSRDFPPNQSQTFLERYETMKRAAQVQSMEVSVTGSPQELDSTPTRTPTKELPRYELSDTRMSS